MLVYAHKFMLSLSPFCEIVTFKLKLQDPALSQKNQMPSCNTPSPQVNQVMKVQWTHSWGLSSKARSSMKYTQAT